MLPSLSVVMPNYNMARYLPEALQSLFSQTFQDFELVFIDDGSTDESLRVVESYRQPARNVRILCNPKNLGAITTINRGVKEALGSYVFFLAADDKILKPTFFETMISLLKKHPTLPMATSDHGMFIDGEEKIHTWKIFPHLSIPQPIAADEFAEMCHKEKLNYWLFAMGAFFRKELFFRYGFFDMKMPVLSDWYLIHLFALKEGFIYVPEIFVAWRHRGKDNLYNTMKSNEAFTLIKRIAQSKDQRRKFHRSTLLGCYVMQCLPQLFLRPHLWDFLWPFALRKGRNIRQKIKRYSKQGFTLKEPL